MSTAGALLDRVQRQLLSGVVEERNKLATGVDADDTSFVTTYELGGLRDGTVFEIDSELVYIWQASTGSKTLTVERGYAGTTAAAHSAGAIIIQNPRFPKAQLLDALNQDIDDLSSPANGLYQVISTDAITYNGSDRQIDMTGVTSLLDLIDVRVKYKSDDFPFVRGVRLQRNLPVADFPSTFALVFDEAPVAGKLVVRYTAPFVRAASTASDIQSVCKVPLTMEDILEMGVMIRVLSVREVKRNFTEAQGDTRRADEVPPGAMRDSFNNILRLRRDRIIAEKAKLARQYPLTIRA
jgi:hypothetical protein